jgi:hypothetical protein
VVDELASRGVQAFLAMIEETALRPKVARMFHVEHGALIKVGDLPESSV